MSLINSNTIYQCISPYLSNQDYSAFARASTTTLEASRLPKLNQFISDVQESSIPKVSLSAISFLISRRLRILPKEKISTLVENLFSIEIQNAKEQPFTIPVV